MESVAEVELSRDRAWNDLWPVVSLSNDRGHLQFRFSLCVSFGLGSMSEKEEDRT